MSNCWQAIRAQAHSSLTKQCQCFNFPLILSPNHLSQQMKYAGWDWSQYFIFYVSDKIIFGNNLILCLLHTLYMYSQYPIMKIENVNKQIHQTQQFNLMKCCIHVVFFSILLDVFTLLFKRLRYFEAMAIRI